ncbi:hypothetical protein J5751_03205 [bacterium]|nr:hypothetical protein [bacterium]
MNNFEYVYKELENLFINKLPDYIEKVNVEHNDGIIIKPFENTKLEENCINLPSFSFALEQAEYEEKDRIIENTVYEISIDIKLHPNTDKQTIIFFRYAEAINMTIKDNENWQDCRITNIKETKIIIRITV